MAVAAETELYEPIKRYWEALGYEVKSEVNHCDLVAVRPEAEGALPVIVELKRSFTLPLVYQGMDRQKLSPYVYLAVEKPREARRGAGKRWSDAGRLCRKLGLGLLTVTFYKTRKPFVERLVDAGEPDEGGGARGRAVKRLLHEFRERSGDYNIGGSARRRLVTAYREQAIAIARLLSAEGPLRPREIRERLALGKAAAILQDNYYGWFERVERGVYRLSERGAGELPQYEGVTRG
ncbi:DUF2161 family putative PD-(D/E)XK-type phosphodiesterase [Paenibacillus thermoaerophilus]|uniref:DUF2161 family putative PD-(D/E)XK-type phosphodiesterase n=1 Tax=Paenibacillus thermoaerophilus TaxID=1215385 RepID=A0ABW2UWY3_9BACL|nr:DUF2161 family putative PD-(D/E)XK-type phosphodiesterase [Paenibacillus thermoaerophilus]TMV15874.1 hypothetical protein FE781_09790 [Paenibacillus thermoaerophilus]